MKRRSVCFLLCISMLLMLFPANAYAAAVENPTVYLEDGSVTLGGSGSDTSYTVNGIEQAYTGTITIDGESTSVANTIIVQSGTHQIVLKDVIINSDTVTPLSMQGGTATVTLSGTNWLGSGWDGVHTTNIVLTGGSVLSIGGDGTLSTYESFAHTKLDIGTGCSVIVNGGTINLRSSYTTTVKGAGTLIVNDGLVRLRSDKASSSGAVMAAETNVILNGGRLEQYERSDPWEGNSVIVNGGVLDTNGVALDVASFAVTNGTVLALSIGDTSGQADWNGTIYEGNAGTIYGTVVMGADTTIAAGKTLTVGEYSKLTIEEDVKLTVSGQLNVNGTLVNDGFVYGTSSTISIPGTLEGSGKIVSDLTYSYVYKNINTDVTGALLLEEGGGDKLYSLNDGATWGIYTGTLNLSGSGDQTSNVVRIQSGTHTVTLSNVNIAATNSPAISCENATVTLMLTYGSVNTLQGGGDNGNAGLLAPEAPNKLTITGSGTLNATGTGSWPGIGRSGNGNLEITEGTINAYGGEDAAGIGGSEGYDGGEIVISGGYITAAGGSAAIGSGSGGGATAITVGANGNLTYVWTGDTSDSSALIMDSPYTGTKSYTDLSHYAEISVQPQDFAVSTDNTDGYTYLNDTLTIEEPGDYEISMVTGVYITIHKIVVDAGVTANITLKGVRINTDSMDSPAFSMEDGTIVNLTLDGETSLASNTNGAGLQVPEGAKLTIGGTGTLMAFCRGAGAAIGGGDQQNAGEIIINSGEIMAYGGDGAAGIGGGKDGSGGTITINGGDVEAIGGMFAAGIGGGENGSGGTVTISGGNVAATGGGFAAGIGGGKNGSGGTVYISGGSIRTASDTDAGAENIGRGQGGESSGTLKNKPAEEGGVDVYLTVLTLSDAANTAIPETDIGFGGTAAGYGRNDLKTDSSGKLYFYIPEGYATAAYGGALYSENVVANHTDNAFAPVVQGACMVTYDLTSLTPDNLTSLALEGDPFSVTLVPVSGFALPAAITVKMGDITLVQGTDYTYDRATGVVSIGSVTGDLIITAEGVTPVLTITAAPESVGFGSLTLGYGASAAQTITVENTGNQSITLIQPTSEKYEIGALSDVVLAPDETATFTIRPKEGLPVGNHDEIITIAASGGASAQVDVSFTVNDYSSRTLTDNDTGISVSGKIDGGAVLSINELSLDDSGACDAIRQRMNDDDYMLLLGKDISLSGDFTGALTITIPVGARYNGQTLTILHCAGGVLETYTATVTNGKAVCSVTSLSPFAVFASAESEATLASVQTASVTDVSDTGAKLRGTVASDGGAAVTERGFVYGTALDPVVGGAGVTKVAVGSGTGGFAANLTGLKPDTIYYVRAYAINSQGTAYGESIRFTTNEDGSIPKTGDSGSSWIWWLLCGIGAVGVVTLTVFGKRRKGTKVEI